MSFHRPESCQQERNFSKPLSGKAPDSDSIPAEIYKNGDPALVLQIQQLFRLIAQQETVPQDLKDASIIHLYKRKGNRHYCNNHRSTSLLSFAGKILARILLNLNRFSVDVYTPRSYAS